MATKRRNLFLYLAIACFIGIVAIFIFDGYVGIHDTVRVTAGEHPQEIGPDYWQNQSPRYPSPYQIGARWGEPVAFRYEINNRRSSIYSATVEASVWRSNERIIDLFRQDISVAGFDRVTMEWTLSPKELEKAGLGVGQYTVRIKRGEIELGRGIVLGFYSSEEPRPPYPKVVPAAPPG